MENVSTGRSILRDMEMHLLGDSVVESISVRKCIP